MSETRSSQKERLNTAREATPYGGQVAEQWTILRSLGRIVGYIFLIIAVFAMSVAVGAGIAVLMEFLLGWPDTWWL